MSVTSKAKLKVLHIGKYYSPFHGGIENYTKELVSSVPYKANVDTHLLVHHHAFNVNSEHDIVDGIKVHRVRTSKVVLYSPIAPSFLSELNHLLCQNDFDLIHIHMPNLSGFCCLLSARARKIPWIIHWHSDVLGSVPDWRIKLGYLGYRIPERLLLKRAKAIIATSPPYLASSKPLAPFVDKACVIPLGLEKNDAQNVVNVSNDDSALNLLVIGRLTYYKGHKYLIKALESLKNVKLNVIGTGELELELKKLVKTLQLEEQVVFSGKVSDAELTRAIDFANLICLPSIEKTEAFGLVLLEAARQGKPSLVTDVVGSGMSWVVKNDETGFVVEAESTEAITAKLKDVNDNKELLVEFGSRALQRFTRYFSIDAVAKQTLDLYRSCLEKG